MSTTWIITGAAGGIGRETVRALAAEGRRLVCVDLSEEALDAAQPTLLPGEIVNLVSDLATPEACAKVVADAGGPVSGLVHLAGILDTDETINADPTHWDRVIGANLRNAYDLSGAIIAQLPMDAAPAKFVFASSLAFRRGAPANVAYAIAKGGIAGLVRSLAKRLGPAATVNGVAPGIIETRMPAELIAHHRDRLLRDIPLQRFGQPAEVASVIAFLMGNGSDYMTGQLLNIDGGMVCS